ncbi:MAG: sensor histidine kinase N-terminal domain-containing protein [Gammaproteobacteria bacterium]|nr:sensor histidine kinase N-terminal domain-containing protein [Gammaproteobacteria bacterium]
MKSIRSYLIIAVLSAITLISFLAALHGYRSSMAAAEALFDKQLSDTASLIADIYSENSQQQKFISRQRDDSDIAFQIWQDETTLLYHSANSPTEPVATFKRGFHDENFNGYRWRILVHHEAGDSYWIIVAERADVRFLLADNIVIESVAATVIGLPIAGLFIWIIIGHGLSLLRRLANELQKKQVDDLSILTLDNPPKELKVVVDAINALLERLELSVARERRLSADAAHELRTPIAALKLHIHNLGNDLSADNPVLIQLQKEVSGLGHLIEQILLLYRISPEHYQARMAPLDLSELARQVIADQYGYFEDKQQSIELIGDTCIINGDNFTLTTLLQNLLSNASKYTPVHGHIKVSIEKLGSTVSLSVIDSGQGMDEAERERVFERFYRIGGDRHHSREQGSGLGLSIVKLIVDLYQAKIHFKESSFASGLAVVILFPTLTQQRRLVS